MRAVGKVSSASSITQPRPLPSLMGPCGGTGLLRLHVPSFS